MRFAARDRVMVLAPHPDDETLGTGGLLQRVRAAGASARIIVATDGDDNPWPQRVLERRIRIRTADRVRWAARRRQEASAALAALGIPPSWAVFLGLPDQGLTAIVTTQPSAAVQQLAAALCDWKPTLLVMPSLHDLHPDHNSLGFLTLQALTAMALADRPVVLTYVVHPLDTPAFPEGVRLHLTVDEQARKRAAIERHATQLVFHGRSYRRAASHVERFAVMSTAFGGSAALPLVSATVRAGILDVRISSWGPRAWSTSLLIVGWRSAAERTALRVEIGPWRRTANVYDSASRIVGTARCVPARAGCRITLPVPEWSASTRLFVKAVSRVGFFDRGGWCEAAGPSLRRVDAEASRPECDAAANGEPSVGAAQHLARFQRSVSSAP
jgi:LmbE family N-acetylglucosaminyl deacetylase